MWTGFDELHWRDGHAATRSLSAARFDAILVGGIPRDVAGNDGPALGAAGPGRFHGRAARASRILFRNRRLRLRAR